MESEIVSGGTYIQVGEDMIWPNPVSDRMAEIEHKMCWGRDSLNTQDLLVAASVLSAYRQLIATNTQQRRNQICSAMKSAYSET